MDPPVLKVVTACGMNIAMQPDGQIALYTSEGLFACECKGIRVPALPERAVHKGTLRRDRTGVAVYQSGINFYTKVTQLAVTDYSPSYPRAGNGGDDGPDIDPEKMDDFCGSFHTDDDCIDDDIEDPIIPAELDK